MKDETANFAPFAKTVYLIAFWIDDLSALHTLPVCVIDKAILQIGGMMAKDVLVRDIKKDLLDPMIF